MLPLLRDRGGRPLLPPPQKGERHDKETDALFTGADRGRGIGLRSGANNAPGGVEGGGVYLPGQKRQDSLREHPRQHQNGKRGDIYTMNPNGAAVERLTDHSERDFEPAWSPDGTNRGD